MLGGGVGRHEGCAVFAAHRGYVDHPTRGALEGRVRPQQGQERLQNYILLKGCFSGADRSFLNLNVLGGLPMHLTPVQQQPRNMERGIRIIHQKVVEA